MSTNKISAALSDADKAKALNSINDLKKLMPFLVSMSNDTKRKSRKMGPKSVDYVNMNLQGAQSFPAIIASTVDIPEFAKDVALVNQLMPLRVAIASLLENIDDTMLAAGSDAMGTADIIYSYLKTGARQNAGVKALVSDIGSRFKGQGRYANKDSAKLSSGDVG
jgi:hypothetical protein